MEHGNEIDPETGQRWSWFASLDPDYIYVMEHQPRPPIMFAPFDATVLPRRHSRQLTPPPPPPPEPGRKKLIHGIWRVTAELSGDAQPVLDLLWDRWQPARGESFVVTHGTADGNVLKVQVEYTARGANGTDVRRRIQRALQVTDMRVTGELQVSKLSVDPMNRTK